jgi:hypothetical protein
MAKKPWRIRRGIYELVDDSPANKKALKIAISDKIKKGEIDSIKGVLIGENKTPHRIGALDKFQKGEVPYITFRDKEARKVSTAARLGSAKDQLSMSSEPYSAKVRENMVDKFSEGLKIKPTSKLHGHHVRMLQMYRPFFEGLDPKDKAALADFAQKTKFPLGDAKANIAILDEDFHQQIHKFMIDKGYQVRKGLPKVEGIPDLGNTFESRKAALQHFFTNVQEPIERKLSHIKWDQQAKYNPPSEAEVQNKLAYLNDKETALDLKKSNKLSKVDDIEVGRPLGGIGNKLKVAANKIPKRALQIGGAALGTIPFLGTGVDAAQFGSDINTAIKKPTGQNIANTVGSGLELVDQTPFMVGPYVNAAIRSKKNKDLSPEERLKAVNKLKVMK